MADYQIKELLKACGFQFNKALGQNFITDTNLLDAIVEDAAITKDDVVVEIGTGAGTLTRSIAKKAKKVYSFEVDHSLEPVLNLSLQGLDNVEVIFKDVLKMSDKAFSEIVEGPFKIVANLPYYITAPLTLRFIESTLPLQSLTIMVQQEVADRFIAKPNTKEYAAVTLAINMAGHATVTRKVPRTMFFPIPNVDSAVVRIDMDKSIMEGEDYNFVKRVVKGAFAMRRKTLVNNISSAFSLTKQQVQDLLVELGYDPLIRGEVLSLPQYIELSHKIQEKLAK